MRRDIDFEEQPYTGKVDAFLQDSRQFRSWRYVNCVAALFVVLFTVYLLVLPALSMTDKGLQEPQLSIVSCASENVTDTDGTYTASLSVTTQAVDADLVQMILDHQDVCYVYFPEGISLASDSDQSSDFGESEDTDVVLSSTEDTSLGSDSLDAGTVPVCVYDADGAVVYSYCYGYTDDGLLYAELTFADGYLENLDESGLLGVSLVLEANIDCGGADTAPCAGVADLLAAPFDLDAWIMAEVEAQADVAVADTDSAAIVDREENQAETSIQAIGDTENEKEKFRQDDMELTASADTESVIQTVDGTGMESVADTETVGKEAETDASISMDDTVSVGESGETGVEPDEIGTTEDDTAELVEEMEQGTTDQNDTDSAEKQDSSIVAVGSLTLQETWILNGTEMIPAVASSTFYLWQVASYSVSVADTVVAETMIGDTDTVLAITDAESICSVETYIALDPVLYDAVTFENGKGWSTSWDELPLTGQVVVDGVAYDCTYSYYISEAEATYGSTHTLEDFDVSFTEETKQTSEDNAWDDPDDELQYAVMVTAYNTYTQETVVLPLTGGMGTARSGTIFGSVMAVFAIAFMLARMRRKGGGHGGG